MKIKLKRTLVDFEGNDINLGNNPLTIGSVLSKILAGTDDRSMDKYRMYELAQKCHLSREIELIGADIEAIKKIINEDKIFAPMISGQVIKMIIDFEKEEMEMQEKKEQEQATQTDGGQKN